MFSQSFYKSSKPRSRKLIFISASVLIQLYALWKKKLKALEITGWQITDQKKYIPVDIWKTFTVSSSLPSTYLVDFSTHYCPFSYRTHYFFCCYLCIRNAAIVHKFWAWLVSSCLAWWNKTVNYRKQRLTVLKSSKPISLIKPI